MSDQPTDPLEEPTPPTSGPTPSPAPLSGLRAGIVAGSETPLWAWTALRLGRVRFMLPHETRADIHLFNQLPIEPRGVVGYLLGAGVVVVTAAVALLRLGVTDVYTESLVYLAIATAIGFLCPALGLLFVLLHAAFDLIRLLPDLGGGAFFGGNPLFALAGHFVSWWLLWLLVVEVPLLTRATRRYPLTERLPAELQVAVQIGGAAIVGGALVYIWALALPLLIRPIYTWVGLSPSTAAVATVQEQGTVLVIVGALAAGAAVALHRRFGVPEAVATPPRAVGPYERFRPYVSRAIDLGLIFLGIGGLITGWFDVVLLVAAVLATPTLVTWVVRTFPQLLLLKRLPLGFRVVLAFVVTFLIGLLITSLYFDSALGSEFFPVVVTTAIGVVVFGLFMGVDEVELPPSQKTAAAAAASVATVIVGAIAGATALLLAHPAVALADNCSSLPDCFNVVGGGIAAAGGAAGAGFAWAISRGWGAPPPEAPPSTGSTDQPGGTGDRGHGDQGHVPGADLPPRGDDIGPEVADLEAIEQPPLAEGAVVPPSSGEAPTAPGAPAQPPAASAPAGPPSGGAHGDTPDAGVELGEPPRGDDIGPESDARSDEPPTGGSSPGS